MKKGSKKILIVEDEELLASALSHMLREYKAEMLTAGSIKEADEILGKGPVDIIILDRMLPDGDGLEVLGKLKKEPALRDIPVLILSGKGADMDKVDGLDLGADDYMVKPFAMRELDARLRALTRAAGHQPTVGVGGLQYDANAMLASREGRSVPLTRIQGALLATLLRNHPNICTHAMLLRAGWGDQGGDLAALQTQVYELRALVDKPFPHPLIRAVRGIGYRLAVPA